ncbi:AAA family ATPase [Lentzea tibetensis]|uniref:AAA family ATPase n=2 Tax=Lentzea tibetensis TaxID=2591470 RepID=A0A563F3R2_9PSEU|nr:AAA family ATPase [Lentzea tibetensis]
MRLLGSAIDRIRERGGAVVVRGEAGIGKSALLLETGRAAAGHGVRVLGTTGVESEARIPFAGLYQLLRPVLDDVAALPGPQRDAVLAAFGRSDVVAPDLHLIALATLNLMGDAAARTPMLLVVEDAQWLDPASADVLAFVARRLEFEPVVLLAALRDGFACPLADAGLPELPLRRLDRTAAATLLDARAPGLPPAVRERVLAEADGNPLALVELPLTAGQAGAGTAWLPLTTRLVQAFAARVSGLPTSTRLMLLVAALNDGDLLTEVVDAASLADGERIGVDDLVPAIDGQLIDVDEERVWFRHPLMRTAIRQRSTIGQRHLVHRSLADVVRGDEDRKVWHRAASAAGPDEDVAAALDVAAANAHRRGGMEAAVTALDRAAALSIDPVRRGERLLRGAELAFELGRHDVVVRLLDQAGGIELPVRQRARIEWIRERFDDGIRSIGAGPRSLTELAGRAVADGEVDLALKVLWSAALRCFWTEPGRAARQEVVAAAERLPIEPDDGRLLAILVFAAPIERGAVVLDRLRHLTVSRRRAARLADAAMLVGAFDLATGFCATAIDELRAQGRLGVLARCLAAQAWSAAHLGELSVAIPAAEEAGRLASETMQPMMHATARVTEAMLAALRGDEETAENLAAEAERMSAPAGARPVLATVQHARGLAALGSGRYAEAYEHLCRMHDPADPAFHVALRCFAIGDLAEAAAHGGRHEQVRDVLADVEQLARVTSSPALHAGLRHARAVLADDTSAEALYEAALREDMPRWSFTRARTQLAYGGWLRRRRRPAESRAPLRAARNAFDALGVIPWSECARQELRASGETSRHRTSDARDRLTPQELQIAQMVAEGLTNREVGQRLYLSHRTVSSHLHRIFPKLGITSRSELNTALRMTVM